MLENYKTVEQKYLFEKYQNEEGLITPATIERLADEFSDDVYAWSKTDSYHRTMASNEEKDFLENLFVAGLYAIREGNEFESVANALEFMFLRWNSCSNGRELNSYLTFYRAFAMMCGRMKSN